MVHNQKHVFEKRKKITAFEIMTSKPTQLIKFLQQPKFADITFVVANKDAIDVQLSLNSIRK